MSRIDAVFGEKRKSEKIDINIKYYIFSEGNVTEPRYFRKLNESILSKNVEILNIMRDYSDSGLSNPSHILALIKELLSKTKKEIAVKELKNKLKNWGHEYNSDVNTIIKEISSKYKDTKIIKYSDLKKLIFKNFKGEIYIDLVHNFYNYLVFHDITFSKGIDKVCLIVDRDNKSFTKSQYWDVASYCEHNDIGFYVSNPCFEFWLYLHFKEIENDDSDKMLENKKVSSSKRYLEQRLFELCGYNKTSFDFKKFEPRIINAIKREKKYEENIIGLENKLGSNVGKLVNEMINR